MTKHEGPTDEAIEISSDRLRVEIARPASLGKQIRFDRTSFVRQVTLDGQQTFCADEDAGGSNGAGLCCEFGISTALGYREAGDGGAFVKPGVGILRRADDRPYAFDEDYPYELFEFVVERLSDSAVELAALPRACNGYALKLTRRFSVRENVLDVTTTMRNEGTRPIAIAEYNHNFVAFNGRPIDGHVRLRTPWVTGAAETGKASLAIEPGVAQLTRTPSSRFHVTFGRDTAIDSDAQSWQLEDAQSGLSIQEQTSLPWSKLCLYGTRKVICPEAFVQIDVLPGKQLMWSRTFTMLGRR
ncbi:MAG TPA: hypothetical protein VGN72_15030 [Tepidisphaeraceae bacterium]|jgi:hypothetical protein|nr:hypothetical protein [Tepidisphaeraceae bacterium]